MRNVSPSQIARPFFLLMAPLITALIAVPAFAQMDFSGDWAPVQDEDNTGNPYTGEFIGIPMSRAGALRVTVGTEAENERFVSALRELV